jgi:polyphosphate kinase
MRWYKNISAPPQIDARTRSKGPTCMSTEICNDVHTELFQDRDLAWIEFNRRVLREAEDDRNPLLERVKFLAIFSSNLDEFFMKRVGLWKRPGAPLDVAASNGSASHQQLLQIRQAILPLLAKQADLYAHIILPQLARHGIHLLGWHELTEHQAQAARNYFQQKVFPILTPLAVDPGHPFPIMSNLSSSLGILLRNPETDERYFARVKIPGALPQLVALPDSGTTGNGSPGPQHGFLRLLDLIRQNLDALFPGMVVVEVMPFRITRSAAVEIDEDAAGESVVEMVEEELRQRRFERVIRLEYGPGSSPELVQLLLGKLDLYDTDAYEMAAELDFGDLFAVAGLNRPELRDKPWQPVVPLALRDDDSDIFAVIRNGDFLVHHPYESFEASVERFIRRAAEDPKVLALKMTAYRVGADTPFLDALIKAAEAGKEVACLVEVTASFDERQNLAIAHALEKAGVHVVYGVVGLKTHCKTTLVVRQDDDGLRCYCHIGTGNYHVKTARLYTDLGLFSCDPELTSDVVNLFHYLTGLSLKRDYHKLLVAPVNMRDRFMAMIHQEIVHQQSGRPAHIIAKMNQLEDRSICEALIEASRAGVQVELIVRGLCILLPGVPGKTDNIRVTSIIGRFLEHSRIYYFRNGADNPLDGLFFIGSADWMHRNLSERVEAITPVQAVPLRERLWKFVQLALADRRQVWDMQPDGSYIQRTPSHDDGSADGLGTQQVLMEWSRPRTNLPAEAEAGALHRPVGSAH